MANINPLQVQRLLTGMSYPVGKAQIVTYAKSAGANSIILTILNQLPDDDYQTQADISQAIGNL